MKTSAVFGKNASGWQGGAEGARRNEMKAVIPKSIQQKIFRMLREGHSEILRMKMLAKNTVYWYGLNEDIERMVRNCDACQEATKLPTKNILHLWPTPEKV